MGYALYLLRCASYWWLRSANNYNNFNNVNSNGNNNNNNANNSNGVTVGSSQADKVTERRNLTWWREGVHDPPERVNTYSDASGRTLLAWYGLQVIPYFMPGDAMCLPEPANRHTEYRKKKKKAI